MTTRAELEGLIARQNEVCTLYSAEALKVHHLCDLAEIPRTTEDGEKFSMAQRVEILSTVIVDMRAAMLKKAMTGGGVH